MLNKMNEMLRVDMSSICVLLFEPIDALRLSAK